MAEQPLTYLQHKLTSAFARIEKENNTIVSLDLRSKVLESLLSIESIFKYYPLFYSFSISAEMMEEIPVVYVFWQSITHGTAFDLGIHADGWFDVGSGTTHRENAPALVRELKDVIFFFWSFVRDTYSLDLKEAI